MQKHEGQILQYFQDNGTNEILSSISTNLHIPEYLIKNIIKKHKITIKATGRTKITNDEINLIKEYKKNGKSIGAIAIILKRGIQSIKNICQRENIPFDFEKSKSRPWTDDELIILRKYINDGIKYRDISKLMKRGHTALKSKINELGIGSYTSTLLENNKKLREQGVYKCNKCKHDDLTIDDFYPTNLTCCRTCVKLTTDNNRSKLKNNSNLDTILKYRYGSSKHRAVKYNMLFDLTIDGLQKIYNKQNGRCYYSDVQLTFSSNSDNVLSIDRIDSAIGYILSNIVLCTATVNSMKNDMSINEFKKIINLINIQFNKV